MNPALLISILLSFLTTLFFTPIWIKKAKKASLVGRDLHKSSKIIAESGGIAVIVAFFIGILSYVAIKTFYFKDSKNLIEIFSLLNVILIAGFVGFVDDVLGWKIGLTRKIRVLLLIGASVPLMVINAGESSMMGIEFGLIYPLILIPLGIVGASTTFNFIAGYNGLETSQGILILSSLAIVTYFTGNSWLSMICLTIVICLIGFYLFNKYPAKVFPGDVLTYPLGALIAIIAILGNIEKIAIFFFIPYIIETGLKVRGKLKRESFAKINSDGDLEIPYKKFYGLEHVAIFLLKKIKGKVYEKEVVYLINLFQILIIGLGLILFKNNIFIK